MTGSGTLALGAPRPGGRLSLPLVLVMLAVVLSTGCVLWFMSQAMSNQRRLARQKLIVAYRGHLAVAADHVARDWSRRAEELDALVRDAEGSAAAFGRATRAGLADSVIIFDRAGRPAYPGGARPAAGPELSPGGADSWAAARALERGPEPDSAAAAVAYAAIASQSPPALAVRARQARVRCLARAGRADAAVQVATAALVDPSLIRVADPEGRMIVADLALRTLQLVGRSADARYRIPSERLRSWLGDYETVRLPAAQRRFLMRAHQALDPTVRYPNLAAETLAARVLETEPELHRPPMLERLERSGVWRLGSTRGRALALYADGSVRARVEQLLAAHSPSPGGVLEVLPPRAAGPAGFALVDRIGAPLTDWRLALRLRAGEPLAAEADREVAVYLWTGMAVIASMSLLTLLAARLVGHQIRANRFKNDLLATVSHELKTPLASMRLLVDTLLADAEPDPVRTREYLQLVDRENSRLSRLIDSFLWFSRMDRQQHHFQFAPVEPGDVVAAAIEVLGDRLQAPGVDFSADVAADLPPILADEEAMVTVLRNLLDNALKYAHPDGPATIGVRVHADDTDVCFEIADNGIGLSPRAQRHIWRRFYQVDRRLSRATGGCGLGLSIVDLVVRAHGGRVLVQSRPGRGSRFTVRVPSAAPEDAPA